MEFAFDASLTRLAECGRELGRTLVRPSVADRDRRASWDWDLFRALARAGLTSPLLPTETGGLGLRVLEAVVLLEGFGETALDPGLAVAAGAHGLLWAMAVATLGTAEQCQRWLVDLGTGDRLGGLSLSEVNGGADRGGGALVATETGEGWRLDGDVTDVLNVPYASCFLVTAATGEGRRTAFLVDARTAGVTARRDPDPGTLRTAPSGELRFADCRVWPDAVLGTPGGAAVELVPLLAALDRTVLLAPWLGLLRALVTYDLALARERPMFGGAPARSQSVRMALTDLHTRAELAAGLLYRAAWQLDTRVDAPRADTAMAKLFLARAIREAADTAGDLAGAQDRFVWRTRRDTPVLTRGHGGVALRSVIAGALLDLG